MTLIRSLSHSSQLLWRKDTCRSWWKLQVPGPHSGAFCVNLWLSPRSLCFSKHSSNSDEGLRQVARGTKSFVWVGVKKDLWSWFLISEVLNYVKMFTVSLQSKEKLELLSPKPFKKIFFFFSKRKEGRVRERECEWRSVFIRCSVDLLCPSLPQMHPTQHTWLPISSFPWSAWGWFCWNFQNDTLTPPTCPPTKVLTKRDPPNYPGICSSLLMFYPKRGFTKMKFPGVFFEVETAMTIFTGFFK